MLSIPVIGLTKDDLRRSAEFRGKSNGPGFRHWPEATLVYDRLKASISGDGTYAGRHEFTILPEPGEDLTLADFRGIPGVDAALAENTEGE